jgi:hypothetical protein
VDALANAIGLRVATCRLRDINPYGFFVAVLLAGLGGW